MKEITYDEVFQLQECLKALADYHNEVSAYFKGTYPNQPFSETLDRFSASLLDGTSRIAVAMEEGKIVGFCKVDLGVGKGKLDYLVVLKEFRKKGYGTALMDWAMEMFFRHQIEQIEVKVVDGNETIHLYEKYGFRMNAHILLYKN